MNPYSDIYLKKINNERHKRFIERVRQTEREREEETEKETESHRDCHSIWRKSESQVQIVL